MSYIPPRETLQSDLRSFFISIVETNDKSNDKYILRNANNGVKDIKGCDANSNCFLAIMQKVNIDFTDTSRKNDKFKELRVRSYTVKDLQWLSCVAHIKTPNNKTNIRDGKYLWGSRHVRVNDIVPTECASVLQMYASLTSQLFSYEEAWLTPYDRCSFDGNDCQDPICS